MSEAEDRIAFVATNERWQDGVAVELARAALVDTLAIGIAGMVHPTTLRVRSALEPLPTNRGALTWRGYEPHAIADVALVHGTACHALDWDDFMHPMHGHCSSVLLPSAWGLAESAGRSGADVLDAFLAGYQVDWLVALVLSHGHCRRGWHATSTIGVLGAATVASRLLGLDADATAAALGIAASSAGGLQNNFGTPTKALHAGLAAAGGIRAAQWAASGMTSSRTWLTGEHGMLAAFGGDVPPDEAAGVVAAGSQVLGIATPWGLVQKPYASCGCSHAAVDAVRSLTVDVDINDIERIEVHVDGAVTRTMRVTVPSDQYDSRYSLTWVVAVAAADGAVGPAQFEAGSLARPPVRALRERVDVISDLETDDDDRFAARVIVHTRDSSREAMVRHASGHPLNPMDEDRRDAKLRQALALATDEVELLAATVSSAFSSPDVAVVGDEIRALTS